MKNKRIKLSKVILLIFMVLFILFLISLVRNFIIISNIEKISKEYSDKTNYIANVYSIQGDSVNIMKSYNKDGKHLTTLQNKVNDVNNMQKLIIYKNGTETVQIIESKNGKYAILNEDVLGGIHVISFFNNSTLLEKLLFSAVAKISTEDCNNRESFYIEMAQGWKVWIDKGNGTVIREINGGFIAERRYEFDVVNDADIAKPDITDCEIQQY